MRDAADRGQNALRIASAVPASAGFSDRKQTGPFVPSQFTFARWGRIAKSFRLTFQSDYQASSAPKLYVVTIN
jgi:hypothetical protein